MRWRKYLGRGTLIAVSAVLLTGCFDFAADSTFRPDGTAQVTAEIGVSMQLAAVLANQPRVGRGDFLADCEKERPADTLPAGVTSIKGKRGQRGDMALCTYVIEVSDPVAAAAAQQEARARSVSGVRGLDRSQLKIERLREGVYRLSGVFKPIDNPLGKPDQPGEALAANAVLMAMMTNRYVTLTVSAARIENATGDVQADGRKVAWKLPLMALVKDTPGMPYEIKADIVYAESWTAKAKRWFGLD
ncbi:hypothetical protein FHP25_24580 [Vineibacter terrae]|uniref:Lipoprotein n=1 Tax=Vineibacter terrae TaxID=2586908 RepID=A0A5C8PGT7_9HYPH|nr:hypothetical protein [Vineibacter terrae]TXL72727.1 hypothetical protein FHP25_24580 [Vineibacter terrae]